MAWDSCSSWINSLLQMSLKSSLFKHQSSIRALEDMPSTTPCIWKEKQTIACSITASKYEWFDKVPSISKTRQNLGRRQYKSCIFPQRMSFWILHGRPPRERGDYRCLSQQKQNGARWKGLCFSVDSALIHIWTCLHVSLSLCW